MTQSPALRTHTSGRPLSMKARRIIGILMLLVGYTALLGGLFFGLAVNPIVGVLLVLGGLALSVCTAIELVDGFGVDPAEYSRERPHVIPE
jgi:hypothetical protein